MLARSPLRRAALAGALLLAVVGCTSPKGDDASSAQRDGAPEQSAPSTGSLRVALPAGVSISVDGEDRGESPATIELPPGEHALVLSTACQRVERSETITAGETTTLDTDPGLAFATLKLSVRAHDDAPLRPTLSLDEVVVPFAPELRIPACPMELRVAAQGRGAYLEPLQLAAGATLERDIVLAPGPEVVRLHGGAFRLGPTEQQQPQWTDEYGELLYAQIPVEVGDFELDRTEVTVAQWRACQAAAEPKICSSDEECARAVGCPYHAHLRAHMPSEARRPYCNAAFVPLDRPAVEGREDHPMNCVARWSAEDYCRWAGKRLPTSVEWEFAARSGDPTRAFPWGNDAPTCDRGQIALHPECPKVRGTAPVCSKPAGNSAQGVCDLYGNVAEYVLPDELDHPDRKAEDHTCKVPGWEGSSDTVFEGTFCYGDDYYQNADVGFRCARSVDEEASER